VTRDRDTALTALTLWAPPIALMAVIFALSAQPDLSSGLGTIDLVLRKLAHMAEYALLVFLWWRPLRRLTGDRTDEIHQTFVNGRHGTPVDVLIDLVGMAAVSVLLLRRSD
jgi:VanZ family protein